MVAVAFDALGPSSSGQVSATSSISWTHTAGTGGGTVLVWLFVSSGSAWGYSFSNVLYGGAAMTLLGSAAAGGTGAAAGGVFLYGIKNRASGANTVSATLSITPSDAIIGFSESFTGGGAFGVAVPGSSSGAQASGSVAVLSSSTSSLVAAGAGDGSGGETWTAGTQRFKLDHSPNSGDGNVTGATSPGTNGTVNMSWTQTSDLWSAIAIEVQPPPPAPLDTSRPPNPPGWFPGADTVTTNPGGVPFYISPTPAASPPIKAPPYLTGIAGTGAGKYWVDQYGDPYLVKSDTAWSIGYNSGQSTQSAGDWHYDIQKYCAIRRSQGFNSFLFAAVGTPNCGALAQNGNTWDGVVPFTSPGVMNEAFWQRVDYVIQTAANYGLSVFCNPMFTYSISNTGAAMSTWTAANFTTYGTALGNRYKNAFNLLWEFGDDYGDGFGTFFDNCLAAIRATGDTHLISVENLSPGTSRFALSGSAFVWGTTNAQYTWCYGYGCAYNSVEFAYLEANPLLVTKMDGQYDTGGNGDPRAYWRWWAWWSLTSGSRGFQYGRNDLFPWPSSALTLITNNLPDNSDFASFWAIFQSLPGWHLLIPDTGSNFITAGRGTRWANSNDAFTTASTNTYVTASKTADGTLAVVYNPAANTQTITVATGILPSGWTAKWVDPVTGASSSAGTGPTFTKSVANSLGANDWLLVFTAPLSPVLNAATIYAASPVPPGWFPGAPSATPGGVPFYVEPTPTYAPMTVTGSVSVTIVRNPVRAANRPSQYITRGVLPSSGLSGIPPIPVLRDRQPSLVPLRLRNIITPGTNSPPIYVPVMYSRAKAGRRSQQAIIAGFSPRTGTLSVPISQRPYRLLRKPNNAVRGPLSPVQAALPSVPILSALVVSVPRRGPPRYVVSRIRSGGTGTIRPVPRMVHAIPRSRRQQQKISAGPVIPPFTFPVQPELTILTHTFYRIRKAPRQSVITGMLRGAGLSGIPETAIRSYPARIQQQPRQGVRRGERGSLTVPAPVPVTIRQGQRLQRRQRGSTTLPPFVPAGIVYQPVSAPTHITSTFYRLKLQPRMSLVTGMIPGRGLSGIPESLARQTVPRLRVQPRQIVRRGERGSLTVPAPNPVTLRSRQKIRTPPQKLIPGIIIPASTFPSQPYPVVLAHTAYRLRTSPRQTVRTGMLPGRGLSGIPVRQVRAAPPRKLSKQPPQGVRAGQLPGPVTYPALIYPAVFTRCVQPPRKVQKQPRQQTRTGWLAWGIIPSLPGNVTVTNNNAGAVTAGNQQAGVVTVENQHQGGVIVVNTE